MNRVAEHFQALRQDLSDQERKDLANLLLDDLDHHADFTLEELKKIDRGLVDLEQGRVRPSDDVMDEIIRGIRQG